MEQNLKRKLLTEWLGCTENERKDDNTEDDEEEEEECEKVEEK